MFFLAMMMMIFGFMICSIGSFVQLPSEFGAIFVMFGMVIGIMGFMMLWIRALKTGAVHLIGAGRPDKVIWFYIHKDGTMKITPSVRKGEGMTYNEELDAVALEQKSYQLFDHKIRFIPEEIGHGVDHRMCLYVDLLKTKYGWNNIKTARKSVRESKEYIKKVGDKE